MVYCLVLPCVFSHPIEESHAIARALGYACSPIPGAGRAYMARSTVTRAQSSLVGVAILARLSPQALESVERRCAFRRYEPGESIVDYIVQTDEVFFIISGE